jgi:CheY-like chemotaxis protein
VRPAVLIAITGYADEACRSRAHALGFYQYLVKPVDPDAVRELLIRVVGYPGLLKTPPADQQGVLQAGPPGRGFRTTVPAPAALPTDSAFFLVG